MNGIQNKTKQGLAGLELRDLFASNSQVLGLQACVTTHMAAKCGL